MGVYSASLYYAGINTSITPVLGMLLPGSSSLVYRKVRYSARFHQPPPPGALPGPARARRRSNLISSHNNASEPDATKREHRPVFSTAITMTYLSIWRPARLPCRSKFPSSAVNPKRTLPSLLPRSLAVAAGWGSSHDPEPLFLFSVRLTLIPAGASSSLTFR